MNISNKNYKFGCKVCEFCGNDKLLKDQLPTISLTCWTCEKCNSEHYWKWDRSSDYIEKQNETLNCKYKLNEIVICSYDMRSGTVKKIDKIDNAFVYWLVFDTEPKERPVEEKSIIQI